MFTKFFKITPMTSNVKGKFYYYDIVNKANGTIALTQI